VACEPSQDKPNALDYKQGTSKTIPIYRLAVHPLHNPRKLMKAYQPLIDYLNQHIVQAHFELEASRDYQTYEVKFRNRQPDILLPNPWQTLEAIKVGYYVISMAGDAEDFKGIFIVRQDASIKTPNDIIGKAVSYPSHTALAACIMPQYYLYKNGIDINKDIQNHYVGSQESSIMNVLLGDVAVGVTWPPPWRLFQKDYPESAAKLKVIWETPSLMNNSIMVRDDIPKEIVKKISHLLLTLHEQKEGKLILQAIETARFYPSDNKSYELVHDFIVDFEQEVRLVEQP